MVQEISGGRPDGTPWPPPGSILEVSDAEGAELCRSDDHTDHPIAVPVVEERTETAVAKAPEPEKRAEPEDAAEDTSEPAEDVAEDAPPVRRGPGRPRRTQ
jgi:hypothetical protein